MIKGYNELRDAYTGKLLEYKVAVATSERLEKEIESDKQKADDINVCSLIIKKTVEKRRDAICKTLSVMGTSAMQYALQDQNIEMQIHEQDYRDSIASNVRIVNTKTGLDTPILGAKGGGIEDIVNTAIRIGIIKALKDPSIDGPIILDEPYKQLSAEYQPAIAEFLNRISSDFGRQIILSTHNAFIRESGGKKIHVTTSAPDTSIVTEEENDENAESSD